MRILHVTDTYAPTVGGIEVFVHDLAHQQAAGGHEVTVITRTPADSSILDSDGQVRVVRERHRLRQVISEADTIHAHLSSVSPLALRAVEISARAEVPVVATVHSMWSDAWPLVRALATTRGWTGLPIQWAAVSAAAAEPVRRAVRRPVLVLPNAVDTSAWVPGEAPHAGPVTIVGVMRMARRKRPLPLLSVLSRARDLVPSDIPLRAVLVGDGAQQAAMRRHAALLGLAWVEMVGPRSRQDIARLYRSAHVFVAPATLESFGIAALEARTAGLAVVARAGTGVEEFVSHGIDGMLADSDGSFAELLAGLCTDRTTLARIQDHNAHHVPRFGWADVLWRNDMAYAAAAALGGATRHPAIDPRRHPSFSGAAVGSEL